MTATKKQLKSTSLKDLLALHRTVGVVIKAKQAQLKKARERILALAAQVGMPARELLKMARRGRGPDKAPRKAKGSGMMHKLTARQARKGKTNGAEPRTIN